MTRRPVHNIRTPGTWRGGGPRKRFSFRMPHLRFRRRWVRPTLLTLGALFVFGVFSTVLLFAWVARDLPSASKINDRVVAQSTKIYDRTGETVLYEIHGEEKRTAVTMDRIADHVKHATLIAEDKDFYQHHGFDLRGIFRAVIVDIIHLDPTGQGGSTITQQFIKNAVLTSEKSYIRKIKEVILAYQLEQRFSKDEILNLYLNEIPYGSNAYGIQAAAETFFGTSAKDLTLAQSALLASLPRGTTYYSPFGNHPDALLARQHAILDGMVREGYATQEEVDAAKNEELTYNPSPQGIIAPHFVFYIRDLLAQEFGDTALDQEGLKVITTLDLGKQKAAEDAIDAYADRNLERYNASNAALVSLDTKTGQILAMVGSKDYFDTANDGNVNVALRPRQPGSSFKPIVYTTGFERGLTPDTITYDLKTNFGAGGTPYSPSDYDGAERGPISLRKALAGSLNIPAVKVLYMAGINNVLDNADKLGYTTLKDRETYGLSLVLGGADVTLLEHTSAYATLAREGIRHNVAGILRIEDRSGKTIREFKNQESQVLETSAVKDTISILTDDAARAYVFGAGGPLTLPDRAVAAKTGTTNDYRDAWTMGFTPSIATGVWVGNNDNSEMKRGADGSIVAAPIWNHYMKSILTGTPKEVFHDPDPNDAEKPILRGQVDELVTLSVDIGTRKVIPASCLATYPAAYVTQAQYKQTHDLLHWLDRADIAGDPPSDPASDPQYAAWEGPVQAWALAHGYHDLSKLPQSPCDYRAGATGPVVGITAPENGATITTATTVFTAAAGSGSALSSVSFAIDGTTIGTASSAPFSISYTNTVFLNGSHTLTVTATDADGATSTAETSFTYNLGHEAAFVAFRSPQDGATFRTSDFPLDLTTTLFDPKGFTNVRLTEGDEVLGSRANPANGSLSFSLSSLPLGTHTLRLTGTNGDGATATATLRLTIQ